MDNKNLAHFNYIPKIYGEKIRRNILKANGSYL
jgi:hypothetical protein